MNKQRAIRLNDMGTEVKERLISDFEYQLLLRVAETSSDIVMARYDAEFCQLNGDCIAAHEKALNEYHEFISDVDFLYG